MENVRKFYEDIIARNEAETASLNRRMNGLGIVRLLLVAGWIAALVVLRDEKVSILLGMTLGIAVPFAVLMVWHDKLSDRRKYTRAWTELCRNELRAQEYDFSGFDSGADKMDSGHPFSFDLDLFGEASLFQSLNRTVTSGGRERLTDWFLHPLENKKAILHRQEAVRELAGQPDFCQRFYVLGSLDGGGKDDAMSLDSLAGHSFGFTRNLFWKIIVWIIPGLWILLGAGFWAGWIPGGVLLLHFIVSTLLGYVKLKEINALHNATDKLEKRLSVYSRLIAQVEDGRFGSALLREIRAKLDSGDEKIPASRVVKKLSRLLNTLDQRANLFSIILNIFMLRDIRTAIRLEQWKQKYQDGIGRWFDALAEQDALCSLGIFAFNHPDYIYPSIADDYFELKGKGVGHPLMRREACVKNDISFDAHPSFMVVTGANMAGKSTYLRTVAVNFLLACVGAPAWAEELTVYPASLVTSLRTSDSLVRNESYFFAELKRLKMIIDRLQSGEKLFIVLDEILKGTNSADKQKGSLALINQFLGYGTCGIIATHDLVLGTLADRNPGTVRNYRFEGEIEGDRLSFTYQLQEGVARNMNATFLMEKMGITV